jgi:hypothetical protein
VHKRRTENADQLPEFDIVPWDSIKRSDVKRLTEAIECSESESTMQKFLERFPLLLVQHLGGGHGRWVLPQKRLGSEYVPDFVIAERSSIGMQWYPVELESPKQPIFNKSGNHSRALNQALKQVMDWKMWLANNLDYARRPRAMDGLGLIDIDPQSMGYIIIGRAADQSDMDNKRRTQLIAELRIQIRTYDWLIDNARNRANAIAGERQHEDP